MRLLVLATAALAGLTALLVVGHLAFIEIGREVVTVRTPNPDGTWEETRLWIVDHDGASWLHSAGARWSSRFEGGPVVEVERTGEVRRYVATADPGPHPRIDQALRDKYGLADRWVRFLAPCDERTVPVRLEPVPHAGTGAPSARDPGHARQD